MAHYGVPRGLSGDYPTDYTDKKSAYTPAWQEIFTGIDSKTIISIAREWGNNGEVTQGKNMVIVGAGINHWYHCNLMYRSAIMALMFTGSIGRNGGGMNHMLGRRSWHLSIVGEYHLCKGLELHGRLQQAPIWH